MKNLKLAVLAFALLGLVACFLPVISMEGFSVSFFDTHKGPNGIQVYLTMLGYAIPLVLGAAGIAKGFARPQAIAALAGFGFVALKLRGQFSVLLDSAIGGKLMMVAMIGGLVVSALAIAKPDDATS